jgi:hypothetical protein
MGNNVHVWLKTYVSRHRRADAVSTTGDRCAPVDLIDLNDRSFGMVQRGCGFDVLRVEGARKPKCAEFR